MVPASGKGSSGAGIMGAGGFCIREGCRGAAATSLGEE